MSEAEATKKPRKASRAMRAYIGRWETEGKEEGVVAVFTAFASSGVGEASVKAAISKLGPGKYDVLTGRCRTATCSEKKRNVTTLS
jgi:hypothetical protein